MNLDTLHALKQEARRWKALKSSSFQLQKKYPRFRVDVSDNPCCISRQRLDAAEFAKKHKPVRFLKEVLDQDAIRELSLQSQRRNPPLRSGTTLINPRTVTYGHRPRSATLHFAALSVDSSCKNVPLPKAGYLSVSDMQNMLGKQQPKTGSISRDTPKQRDVPNTPKQRDVPNRKKCGKNRGSLKKCRKKPWNGVVFQPIMESRRRGKRPEKAVVNALKRQDTPESYHAATQAMSKVSSGAVYPHPFCLDRQDEDIRQSGKVNQPFRAEHSSQRRYISNTCIHSTTPRRQASLRQEAMILLGLNESRLQSGFL